MLSSFLSFWAFSKGDTIFPLPLEVGFPVRFHMVEWVEEIHVWWMVCFKLVVTETKPTAHGAERAQSYQKTWDVALTPEMSGSEQVPHLRASLNLDLHSEGFTSRTWGSSLALCSVSTVGNDVRMQGTNSSRSLSLHSHPLQWGNREDTLILQ